jgi:hypothetical protein
MPYSPHFGYQSSLPPEVIMALIQMGQARQGADAAQGQQQGNGGVTGGVTALGAKEAGKWAGNQLFGSGAASAAGQTAAQGAAAAQGGMSAAGAAEAGNLAAQGAQAATGGGSSAAGAAGINPMLGAAAFMAAAPIYSPYVAKGGDWFASKVLGMGSKYQRPWNEKEAANSKALGSQIKGFSEAPEDRRLAVARMLKERGMIEAARPAFWDDGSEMEGTSYRMQGPAMRNAALRSATALRMADQSPAGASLYHPATKKHKPLEEELADLRKLPGIAVKNGAFSDIEQALAEAQRMLGSAGGQQPMQGMVRGPMAPNVQEMIGLRPTPGNLDQFDFDPSKLPAFGGQQIQRAPQAPARSKTSSPGIGKDGKRIKY